MAEMNADLHKHV